MGECNNHRLREAILCLLEGSGSMDASASGVKVKKLRKQVLLSLQLDEDKTSKKTFKNIVKSLEDEGIMRLDKEGIATLLHSNMVKKRKKNMSGATINPNQISNDSNEQTPRKHHRRKCSNTKIDLDSPEGHSVLSETLVSDEKQEDNSEIVKNSMVSVVNSGLECNDPQHKCNNQKSSSCKGNPQGITRLFLGNLPFAVDEISLQAFLPGVTHVKWITDKETGKFYGSAFVEMDTSESAALAVAKAGTNLMQRPVKINFAPSRPGDLWPPQQKVVLGGKQTTGGQAGGSGIKSMGPKPENCVKLFIGNLSYDIDDEGATKFFANVDAEVKAIRWLHHKDTGDFKGV